MGPRSRLKCVNVLSARLVNVGQSRATVLEYECVIVWGSGVNVCMFKQICCRLRRGDGAGERVVSRLRCSRRAPGKENTCCRSLFLAVLEPRRRGPSVCKIV